MTQKCEQTDRHLYAGFVAEIVLIDYQLSITTARMTGIFKDIYLERNNEILPHVQEKYWALYLATKYGLT